MKATDASPDDCQRPGNSVPAPATKRAAPAATPHTHASGGSADVAAGTRSSAALLRAPRAPASAPACSACISLPPAAPRGAARGENGARRARRARSATIVRNLL